MPPTYHLLGEPETTIEQMVGKVLFEVKMRPGSLFYIQVMHMFHEMSIKYTKCMYIFC